MRFRRALLAAAFCLAAAENGQASPPEIAVAVRAENRAGFGRLSFNTPARARFSVTRDGDRVIIEFADPHLAVASPGEPPRNVVAASGGAGRVEITVAAG